MFKSRVSLILLALILTLGLQGAALSKSKRPTELPPCNEDGSIPNGERGCIGPDIKPTPHPSPQTPTGDCDEADLDCDGRRDLPPVGPGPMT